jgi:hypothetical protein
VIQVLVGDLTDLQDVLIVCNLGSHLREGLHLVAAQCVVAVLLMESLERSSEWEFATEGVALGLVQLQPELIKSDCPLRRCGQF